MPATVTSAPGALETVRAFVNTLDIEDGADRISTPDSLGEWLRGLSLLAARAAVRDQDVSRAKELREALRAALVTNHDRAPAPPEVVAVLNEFADRARLTLRLDERGRWAARPRAQGIDGALGALVAIVADAMAAGTWSRLKVCANDACQWAFYDQSRARSGRWCSMQVCGNRVKQQSWRDRRAQQSTE